jgi:MSHA biogenesis protein MshP
MSLNLNYRYHKPNQNGFNPVKQSGISMAFLLFTIVVVSLLAAALMKLNSQSGLSVAHQVISTRAFFAAESAANLQALSIFPVNGGAANCTNQTFNFNTPGLEGCSATTTCDARVVNTVTFYRVQSQGVCNAGQPLQATRTIEVRLKDIIAP